MKLPFSRSKASPTGKSVPDLPFGSEDVVEVTKYGHLDVSCGRIEATVILNSGDKLIKLEALKKRWEFYECYKDSMETFFQERLDLSEDFDAWRSGKGTIENQFKDWLYWFCHVKDFEEKEADK